MDSQEQRDQTYRALQIAAERIGANNYRAGVGVIRKGGRVVGFNPTPEHRQVVAAMPKVLTGEMDVNTAMAMLHEHDVMQQRLG